MKTITWPIVRWNLAVPKETNDEFNRLKKIHHTTRQNLAAKLLEIGLRGLQAQEKNPTDGIVIREGGQDTKYTIL